MRLPRLIHPGSGVGGPRAVINSSRHGVRVDGRERAFMRLPLPDALAERICALDVKGLEWRTREAACRAALFSSRNTTTGRTRRRPS